jgi:hypothetical protein
MRRASTQFLIANIEELPITVARDLALTAIAAYPQNYEYDSTSGRVTVHCDDILNSWIRYTQEQQFDNNIRRLLDIINGFLARHELKKNVQEFVRELLQSYKDKPCYLIDDLITYDIGFNPESGEVNIKWGRGNWIRKTLAPGLLTGVDYMEAARILPTRQLVTKRKKGKGDKEVIEEGFKRMIEVSNEVYSLIVIGASLSFISRSTGVEREYYFIVPKTLDKDLCSRFNSIVNTLRERVGRLRLSEVSDHLLLLMLVSAVRAPRGSVTLYALRGRGKDVRVNFEFSLEFDNLRFFIEALELQDPHNNLLRATVRVASDLQSEDKNIVDLARSASEILRSLVMLVYGVGEPSYHVHTVSRLAHDRSLIKQVYGMDEERRRPYEWILENLPRLAMNVVELRSGGLL